MTKKILGIIAIFLIVLLFSATINVIALESTPDKSEQPASIGLGVIRGIVILYWGTGGWIPVYNADVYMKNVNTGITYHTKTGILGRFIKLGLPLGTYNIWAEDDDWTSETQSVTLTLIHPISPYIVLSFNG